MHESGYLRMLGAAIVASERNSGTIRQPPLTGLTISDRAQAGFATRLLLAATWAPTISAPGC
jgi:hypothetical protein